MGVEDLHLFVGPDAPERIDIMHFSLPCKFWSPAHTHETNEVRDEANRATLFVIQQILRKFQPKIAMFEQTFGLLTMEDKHAGYFQSVIGDVEAAGYDVAWKIVDFKDYGLAQSRRRIVMYASNRR